MTLTISLPPELEKSVRHEAAKLGQDLSTFVAQAVSEKIAKQQTPQAKPGGMAQLIDEIHRRQDARAYRGRSAEEIEAVRREGEAEYEQRMRPARTQDNSTGE